MKGALPFQTLFFNAFSVWEWEDSQRRWVKPCHPPTQCVCVSLWLSESLLLLGFFFPWIKYLVCYLWVIVHLHLCFIWPLLSLPQSLSVHMWGALCLLSLTFLSQVCGTHFFNISESNICSGEACALICLPFYLPAHSEVEWRQAAENQRASLTVCQPLFPAVSTLNCTRKCKSINYSRAVFTGVWTHLQLNFVSLVEQQHPNQTQFSKLPLYLLICLCVWQLECVDVSVCLSLCTICLLRPYFLWMFVQRAGRPFFYVLCLAVVIEDCQNHCVYFCSFVVIWESLS